MFLEYIATYQTHSRWLFSNFMVIDLNISHVCIKYESENDMRDILDPINPPLFPTNCNTIQKHLLSQKENLIFLTSKMDFRNFCGGFSVIFSFVLSVKATFAACHNCENVKILL